MPVKRRTPGRTTRDEESRVYDLGSAYLSGVKVPKASPAKAYAPVTTVLTSIPTPNDRRQRHSSSAKRQSSGQCDGSSPSVQLVSWVKGILRDAIWFARKLCQNTLTDTQGSGRSLVLVQDLEWRTGDLFLRIPSRALRATQIQPTIRSRSPDTER